MTDKKTRTPRDYAAIEKGALALGLAERIALVKKLQESNQAEVNDLKQQSAAAEALLKG